MQNRMCVKSRRVGRRGLSALLAALVACMAFGACATAKTVKAPAPAAQTESAAQPGKPLDGKRLVQERCTVCHGMFRVKVGKILPVPAHTVVDVMIRKGAQLNPEERQVVIDYLKY